MTRNVRESISESVMFILGIEKALEPSIIVPEHLYCPELPFPTILYVWQKLVQAKNAKSSDKTNRFIRSWFLKGLNDAKLLILFKPKKKNG